MTPSHSGSLRLFRFAGIQVYLHWSWFVVALYEISSRMGSYRSPMWNVAEYLTLFAVVTMHEFGHALACRQTGGEAREIILWPLGGIAFVAPPQRPGAQLWSIAAGPLVNVVLAPVFWLLFVASAAWSRSPDVARFLLDMFALNVFLLKFNLLPVYPLDGGQILRSLLWFVFGRAKSLKIAAVLGLVAIAGAAGYVLLRWSPDNWLWPAVFAIFLGQRCWVGLREARYLTALERMPRHTGFACPTCHAAPPGGPIWLCRACRRAFDPFSTNAICPHCRTPQQATVCVNCGSAHPIDAWRTQEQPPVIDV
ncbi:MAG TPA: M50 family metallopeptidase [Opitutaceae bacterium]|nr:M50 family metallopeptidase [Opitutaceae bacterium]